MSIPLAGALTLPSASYFFTIGNGPTQTSANHLRYSLRVLSNASAVDARFGYEHPREAAA